MGRTDRINRRKDIVTKHPVDPLFGGRVKDAMHGRRMQPGDLAREMGVHGTTVSRWRGGRVPEEATLRHLAGVLRVLLNWLKSGQGERHAAQSTAGASDPADGVGGPHLDRAIWAVELALEELRKARAEPGSGEVLARDAGVTVQAGDQILPPPARRRAAGPG